MHRVDSGKCPPPTFSNGEDNITFGCPVLAVKKRFSTSNNHGELLSKYVDEKDRTVSVNRVMSSGSGRGKLCPSDHPYFATRSKPVTDYEGWSKKRIPSFILKVCCVEELHVYTP